MADSPVFETRTPEQLARAVAVSPDALTVVQEPGGPVQALALKQLLGKLISTNAAFETEAARNANLNFVANSICLTYADPNPAKNGWSRKIGASGVGSWSQFETLSGYALAGVQALVDEAEVIRDETVAAAATVNVTTYTHEFSVNDRTATLTVATELVISGGTINNLVDGATANSNADGVSFNGQAVAGKVIFSALYGSGRSIVANQLRIRCSGNIGDATGQMQVLQHDGVWANRGAVQSVCALADQYINFANTEGHAGLRILGVAGNLSGGGRMLEIDIKCANGPQDKLGRLPAAPGLPGDTARVGAWPDRGNQYSPRYGILPVHAGVNRMALFMMDDARDSGMIINRLADQYHFDFRNDRATYGPAPKKSAKGWLFKKQMVRSQANITGVRTVAVLMRKARGNNSLYEISTSIAGELLYVRGEDFRNGTTIRVLAPNGEIMPVFGDSSGSNTAGATWLNRGYWHLAFIETAAALGACIFGLGGDPNNAVPLDTTTHADFAEFAYLSFFDGQLSDAMCKAEAEWLCPIMKNERGITLRNEETTRSVDLLLMWGQSNIGGDAIVSGGLTPTPKQLLEMANIPSVLIQSSNRPDRPYMTFPAPYAVGTTSLMSSPSYINAGLGPNYAEHDGRKYGPDWQMARLAAMAKRPRQLVINKVGADGTILAHPAEGGGGATSWHPLTAWKTGVLGHALTRLYETMQWLLDQGLGFDIPAFWWGQGETTVNPAQNALQTTNWGTNFNDMFAAIRLYTANMVPLLRLITRLRDWEAGCVGDQVKTGQLRAIQDGLAAADPTNVKILSADGVAADAWGRIPGYHPEVGGQLLHYNGALLDRLATDANALIPWNPY